MLATLLFCFVAAGGDDVFTERKICNVASPGVDAIDGPPVFSPNGKKVAYVLRDNNKKLRPVVNEQKGNTYDFVDAPVWARDADVVAWRVGNRVNTQAENWYIYLDTKKIAESDWIGLPAVSPDGKVAAFWLNPGARLGRDGAYEGGKWIFQFGTKKSEEFKNGFGLDYPIFSPDGKHVATQAVVEKFGMLMIDGILKNEKGEESPRAVLAFLFDGLVYSPDGRELAFAVQTPAGGGKLAYKVYRGGEQYGVNYEMSGAPVFSPDGKSLVYRAYKDKKLQFIREDKDHQPKPISEPFDALDEAVFSPDGARVAMVANRGGSIDPATAMGVFAKYNTKGGEWIVVNDGKEGERYDAVADPVFSSNGKKLAYRGKRGRVWRVIVDGQKSDEYDFVGRPIFSKDGSKVAFGARKGAEFLWKVWDLEPPPK